MANSSWAPSALLSPHAQPDSTELTPVVETEPPSDQAAVVAQHLTVPVSLPTLQAAAEASVPAVQAQIKKLLTDWVSGAAPQLGPEQDQLAWFLSKRANVLINMWLTSKRLAVLAPYSPAGTGCIMISREAVEHCRDHRALEGVGQPAVIELLDQLFVSGHPAYAPNTSNGKHGTGYPNQLAMFDKTYTAVDTSARGETPVGILQHVGAPFVHLMLITAYWTKPGSATTLRSQVLKK